MRILLIGSGGREHALAWKMTQSPLCSALFTAPGNAGTAELGVNIPVKADDFEGIAKAAADNHIEFIVVGPDDPLALGITDFLNADERTKHLPVLGPLAAGAMLEGSKSFAKEFMMRHNIPTASYRVFESGQYDEAREYVKNHDLPVVIKADGLAAGKGVAVCQTVEDAIEFLDSVLLEGKFGKAGSKAVIEGFLDGIEMSVFILTDGNEYVILPEAKDYKRVGEGDTGPNTGGMGTVSPVPFMDEALREKIRERVIVPTVQGLKKDGIPYRGFIFFGLINVNGDPFVIEYNARMGDPETQVVMPRIKSDILPFFLQTARGELKAEALEITPDYAAAVIAVSEGYPGSFETGKEISGLENVQESIIFHAGTRKADGKLLTSGGRVMAVTSLSPTLKHALEKSYESLKNIRYDNLSYRKDIGQDLLTWQKANQ